MGIPASEALRPTMIRWRIVALLAGIVFLAHFNRISISVAATSNFIGPDKLSEAQMGSVYSAFLFIYTLGMLPGGWVIDRIGPYRALAGMGLGLGFLTALTGVLGWMGLAMAAMFVPLLAIRSIAGATSVPLHPGAARSVSLWLPIRERSRANGLITAGALLGVAFTYPVFGSLMDNVGWPMAFVICGTVMIAFGLLWYSLAADRPAEHPACNTGERDLVAVEAAPRSSASLGEILKLFSNRSLVLLTLSYGAIGYTQYLFFYWIEYYFKNVLNAPPSDSREAAFVISVSMAVGMAAGGWMTDMICRHAGHLWGCRIVAFVGMGLGGMFSLLGLTTSDARTVTICFSLAFAALGLCESIFWTTAPILEERNGGLACALVNTGGNGFGMLAPIVTPIIGEHFGWKSAIIVACVMCAVGGLLWLGIHNPQTNTRHDSKIDD
ncbi:MFS transporter [Zavarzinella formosa]|uniref:MFS transporter n=1 Tax=Zavarzinella formosa TaxID=360055 RepID=UPI000305D1C6|nr:MFS transporter [Zavarzinella formosa]